jgi:hypothetical protein
VYAQKLISTQKFLYLYFDTKTSSLQDLCEAAERVQEIFKRFLTFDLELTFEDV